MNDSPQEMPHPMVFDTDAIGNTFIDLDVPGDSTIRPSRFKHPRAWPEGMPIPKADDLNGQHEAEKPAQAPEGDKGQNEVTGS